MRPWRLDLAAIGVPVDLWYGEHDTSHSPDNGATLATPIPSATRHPVPGIGGALLWTHAEPILRHLLERRANPEESR
jgi:pimeloyl-ACP methyl ester carboxylesterase